MIVAVRVGTYQIAHLKFKNGTQPLFPVHNSRLFHNVQHQLSEKGQLVLSLAQSHAGLHLK